MSLKSKDAKKVKEFDITPYKKGFESTFTIDEIITNEYFQFREIYQIIHYPGNGVEVVNYNENRRVFYNDEEGQSKIIFDTLTLAMKNWMESNLN